MNLKIKRLTENAVLPKFAHDDDACFDITATARGNVINGASRIYSTGLAFEIPSGYYVELYIRSSVAFKGGFTLANSVGIIDSGYRGEIMAKLVYIDNGEPYWPAVGDRIMQGRLVRKTKTTIEEVTELDTTERGEGGIGSTGR